MAHILSYAQHSILDTYITKISTTWRLLLNKDVAAAIITLAYDNNQKVIVALINAFINANNLMGKSPEKQVWEQFIIDLIMCLINHGIHCYFIEAINEVKSGDISFKQQDKDIQNFLTIWEDPCYDHHHPETEMADNIQDHIKNMNLALHEVIDWIKRIEYRLSKFTKGPRHLSKEDYIAITCTMDELEDKETYKKGKETTTDLIPTHPNLPTSLNMSQQPVKT